MLTPLSLLSSRRQQVSNMTCALASTLSWAWNALAAKASAGAGFGCGLVCSMLLGKLHCNNRVMFDFVLTCWGDSEDCSRRLVDSAEIKALKLKSRCKEFGSAVRTSWWIYANLAMLLCTLASS